VTSPGPESPSTSASVAPGWAARPSHAGTGLPHQALQHYNRDVPITNKRLLVVIASIGLISGALSSVLIEHSGRDARSRAVASASIPLALNQEQNTPPEQTSCLDLPLSSQLIRPESCWRMGPTSMLIAGTSPSLAGAGAIAVLPRPAAPSERSARVWRSIGSGCRHQCRLRSERARQLLPGGS